MSKQKHSENGTEDSAVRYDRMIAAAREQIAGLDDSDLAEKTPTRRSPNFIMPPPDSFTGYRIVKEVHRGGQGVVFQAIQEATKRKVAIKVMKEGPFAGSSDKARFDREVQILAQLNHPNIVAVHDTGVAAGCHYFVMDYVSGQPLDVAMASGEWSIEQTLKLFAKICVAVNAAHLRGVIHRDLKPGNIRVDSDGEPHVLDFGLAKVATSDAEASAMTMTGQFVGSLPWASPEQAEGVPGKIDLRTDVYSLGVILYQMLTGKFPYHVLGNMRDVIDDILTAEPVRPRTLRKRINDEVETITLKCLKKERARRYQTAGELGRDVQHYLNGEPIEAKRDSLGYVFRKRLRRHKVAVGAVGGVFIALVGGAIVSTAMYLQAETARAGEQAQREIAEAVNEFLNDDLLAAVAPSAEAGRGREITMLEVLAVTAQRMEDACAPGGRFADKPLIEAALRTTLGNSYLQLGEYPAAELHLERALELQQRVRGKEDAKTLDSLTDLASLYLRQSRFSKAEELLARALNARRRVLGEAHRDTLESMNDLALSVENQGRFDEAEQMLRQTLSKLRAIFGNDDPDTLTTLNNLGLCLHRQGRLAEAVPLLRQSLEEGERVWGDEDPKTLFCTNNLALALSAQRKYVEAEELFRRTVAVRSRVLGDKHPLTLGSTFNLGWTYYLWDKLDESEPLMRRACEGLEQVQGENHVDTLLCMNNLAVVLQRLRKYEEAEEFFSRAVEGRRGVLGDEHGDTLGSMFNLGWTYLEWGRPDDAELLFQRVVETAEQAREQGDSLTAIFRTGWGACLTKLGRYEQAEKELLAGQADLEKWNPDHGQTQRAIRLLIELYEAWDAAEPGQGYTEKAAQWRAKLPTPQLSEVPSEP